MIRSRNPSISWRSGRCDLCPWYSA